MSKDNYHVPVAIAGAGVVGLSIAKELATIKEFKENVFVFEKSKYLGEGQSGRNSGVIHAGIYYPEDTLKAQLCVEGNKRIKKYASINNIPYAETGKLIVATNNQEDSILEFYLQRAINNGVEKIRKISGKEAQVMVSNIGCISALYSPSTGIIDAASYLKSLEDEVQKSGSYLLMENEITAIRPEKDQVQFEVRLGDGSKETYQADIFINAAGLYADKLATMINPKFSHKIEPLRGEYCTFFITRESLDIKGMNIYPTPYKYEVNGRHYTTIGVHLTPTFTMDLNGKTTIGKRVLVGPGTKPVQEKDDFQSERLPKEFFYQKVNHFFPNLKLEDLELGDTGIRAKLNNYNDFVIERDERFPHCIQIVGSDSPFLTASASVGPFIRKLLGL